MITITKEEFCGYIYILKEQIEVDNNIQKGFQIAYPDCYAPVPNNPAFDGFIELLSKCLGFAAKDNTLSWWIYDTNFGKDYDKATIWTDNEQKEWHLDGPEEFYNFAVYCDINDDSYELAYFSNNE